MFDEGLYSKEIEDFLGSLDFGAISRAYRLIRIRRNSPAPKKQNDPYFRETERQFNQWIVCNTNRREKDLAMRMVFADAMDQKKVEKIVDGYLNRS